METEYAREKPDQGHYLDMGDIWEVPGLLKQVWMATHAEELMARSKIHAEQEKSKKWAETFHYFTSTLLCTHFSHCYFQKIVTPPLKENVPIILHWPDQCILLSGFLYN